MIDTQTNRADREYIGAYRKKTDAIRSGVEHAHNYLQLGVAGLKEPFDYSDKNVCDKLVDLLYEEDVHLEQMILE